MRETTIQEILDEQRSIIGELFVENRILGKRLQELEDAMAAQSAPAAAPAPVLLVEERGHGASEGGAEQGLPDAVGDLPPGADGRQLGQQPGGG